MRALWTTLLLLYLLAVAATLTLWALMQDSMGGLGMYFVLYLLAWPWSEILGSISHSALGFYLALATGMVLNAGLLLWLARRAAPRLGRGTESR